MTESANNQLTLLLEGRITNGEIGEIEHLCEEAFARQCRLTLDLSGVSFVAREGVALMQKLVQCHAQITNCSGFVAEQLRITYDL